MKVSELQSLLERAKEFQVKLGTLNSQEAILDQIGKQDADLCIAVGNQFDFARLQMAVPINHPLFHQMVTFIRDEIAKKREEVMGDLQEVGIELDVSARPQDSCFGNGDFHLYRAKSA